MDRRKFVVRIGGALITAPMAVYITGCGYGDDDNNPTAPSDSEDGFNVTSSTSAGHTHSLQLLFMDLSSPPSDGISYTSTSSGGHTHRITLSQQQLTDINNGEQLMVTSTQNSGHTHSWTVAAP